MRCGLQSRRVLVCSLKRQGALCIGIMNFGYPLLFDNSSFSETSFCYGIRRFLLYLLFTFRISARPGVRSVQPLPQPDLFSLKLVREWRISVSVLLLQEEAFSGSSRGALRF